VFVFLPREFTSQKNKKAVGVNKKNGQKMTEDEPDLSQLNRKKKKKKAECVISILVSHDHVFNCAGS
jgi:hypothetical protein